jgi:hypothetical protein
LARFKSSGKVAYRPKPLQREAKPDLTRKPPLLHEPTAIKTKRPPELYKPLTEAEYNKLREILNDYSIIARRQAATDAWMRTQNVREVDDAEKDAYFEVDKIKWKLQKGKRLTNREKGIIRQALYHSINKVSEEFVKTIYSNLKL